VLHEADDGNFRFTQKDSLLNLLDIAKDTAEELLEDPTPISVDLLRMTVQIMTHEVDPDFISSLGFSKNPQWKLLYAYADGKHTSVDKIVRACEELEAIVFQA
jgi:hypothetical protein